MGIIFILLVMLPLVVFIIIPFMTGRRINLIQIIPAVIGLGVVLMVGWTVLGEVNEVLYESGMNTTSGVTSLLGTEERVPAQYVPSSDVEKTCVGKTTSIAVMQCDKSGRICESKTVDCARVNSEGYDSVKGEYTTKGGGFFGIFGIMAIVLIIIVAIGTMNVFRRDIF